MNKTEDILVECKNLCKTFGHTQAVKNVSLSIKKGECYGLVGESGSGKSTLGNLLCGLEKPDRKNEENILYNGKDRPQMIFQDPYATLNPMHKISYIIEEPLIINRIGKSKEERAKLVNEIRTLTGLSPEVMEKYPHQLSGGQRQRVAIASAMILKPEFIVCDECVSALDVLIQAQILNLLRSMQKSMKLTYLFISHNLNVVAWLADRIGVMYKGELVEEKPVKELLENPEHPYTKKLIASAGIKLQNC